MRALLGMMLMALWTGGAQAAPASIRSTTAPVDDHIVECSMLLPVSADSAFAWFSEPARLERWLTADAEVEPRVGGVYQLFWRPADRENDSTIGCRITAWAPGEVLAFQWRSPRQFKSFANAADPLTHVTVSFHAVAGGTRVHLLHTGWRSTPQWEAARLWQERAWTMALHELGERTSGR